MSTRIRIRRNTFWAVIYVFCFVARTPNVSGESASTNPSTTKFLRTSQEHVIPQRLWFVYESNFIEDIHDHNQLPLNINNTINAYIEAWGLEAAEVNLLNNDQCDEDVAAAEPQLLSHYQQETSTAKRSEICRISVLYMHGGYFFDMNDDLEVAEAYVPKNDALSFLTVLSGVEAFSNFFIASAPTHTVLRQTLAEFLAAYRTGTGSAMLGPKALASAYFAIPERERRETHLLATKVLEQGDYPDMVKQKGWSQCTAIIHDSAQSKVHFISRYVANEECQLNSSRHRGLLTKKNRGGLIKLLAKKNRGGQIKKAKDKSSGMVVVVANQPKAGTGTITRSMRESLRCVKFGHVDHEVLRFDCAHHSTVFQTHSASRGAVETLNAFRKGRSNLWDTMDYGKGPFHPEQHVTPGKCLVITAVRNPLRLLPSWFAENYRPRLLSGEINEVNAEGTYRRYLQKMPKRRIRLYEDTLYLLEEFGATNMTEELVRQEAEGGSSFLENPDPGGPWRGCKLLFLRLEAVETWPEVFSSAVHRPVELTTTSTLGGYPNAIETMKTLKDTRKFASEISAIAEAKPVFGEVLTYYESLVDSSNQGGRQDTYSLKHL